jgi:hypothetical protein
LAAAALEEVSTLRGETVLLTSELDRAKGEGLALAARTEAAANEVRSLSAALQAAETAQLVEWGGEQVQVREAVQRVTASISDRTARVAAANLGSMAGESIPIYGIAIVVAATAYELKASCDSMKEMHELEVALGVVEASDAQVQEVCGLQVPTREEIWGLITSSPGAVWDGAVSLLDVDLPSPDFGGMWERTLEWFGGWFDE